MPYSLTGKIALITGSSRGIGKATALAFSQKGAIVIVHYNDNLDAAAETMKHIDEQGGDGMVVQANMNDRTQIKAMFERIFDRYGTIDILINNAGGIGPVNDFELVNFDDIQNTISTNLFGPMYCSQLALKQFKQENKKGIILSTSSIHDGNIGGNEKALAYCVSKAGLTQMTKMLARAGAPDIRVNAIAPGPVLTEQRADESQETIDEFASKCLIQRRITPEEIAHGFIFLAENEGATGQIMYLDGGFRS